jgi:hypothetical protein
LVLVTEPARPGPENPMTSAAVRSRVLHAVTVSGLGVAFDRPVAISYRAGTLGSALIFSCTMAAGSGNVTFQAVGLQGPATTDFARRPGIVPHDRRLVRRAGLAGEPGHGREAGHGTPAQRGAGEFAVESIEVDHQPLGIAEVQVVAQVDVHRRLERRHPGVEPGAGLCLNMAQILTDPRDAALVRQRAMPGHVDEEITLGVGRANLDELDAPVADFQRQAVVEGPGRQDHLDAFKAKVPEDLDQKRRGLDDRLELLDAVFAGDPAEAPAESSGFGGAASETCNGPPKKSLQCRLFRSLP